MQERRSGFRLVVSWLVGNEGLVSRAGSLCRTGFLGCRLTVIEGHAEMCFGM